MNHDSSRRDAELACDCGYVAHGADDDELVAAVQAHAWDVHDMKLSAELILAMAHPNGTTAARPGSEREREAGGSLSMPGPLR